MKILVTGGLGFIGSQFIRYMFKRYGRDVDITNLDAFTYAANTRSLNGLETGNLKYSFRHADIADAERVDAILREGFDAVVNFAAESHVDRSIEDGSAFVRSNVLGTYNLLAATRLHGAGRFLQVSTDEVYGSIAAGSFTEQSPLNPSSAYSASKAAADLLALAEHHTHGQNIVITRCTNNYGPCQHPEKLIPKTILNALDNRVVPIYGHGGQVRDWLHVEDHAEAIATALEKGKAGEIYNIAGNAEQTNLQVVSSILQSLQKPAELACHVPDRPGHDERYSLDCRKIRQLGWKPRRSFGDGIVETVEWYSQRGKWWISGFGKI